MFSLSASPAQGVSPEALELEIKKVLQRVAEQGVTEAELNRVKNQWAASEVFKLDSAFAQARELGTYWALGWPLNSMELLMQRLRQVQPTDVQRVARKYVLDSQLTVGLLLPEVQP